MLLKRRLRNGLFTTFLVYLTSLESDNSSSITWGKELRMSICNSGMDCKLSKTVSVVIDVTSCHPLMKLMNTIDWGQLSKLIMPDLKKSTSKLKWWLGRKLKMRTHLGVYLLQQLLNETDRGI